MEASFTIKEIADNLTVSRRTVEAWIESGELTAVNVSRKGNSRKPRLRVLQSSLDLFLQSRATQPVAKPVRKRRVPYDGPDFFPQYK